MKISPPSRGTSRAAWGGLRCGPFSATPIWTVVIILLLQLAAAGSAAPLPLTPNVYLGLVPCDVLLAAARAWFHAHSHTGNYLLGLSTGECRAAAPGTQLLLGEPQATAGGGAADDTSTPLKEKILRVHIQEVTTSNAAAAGTELYTATVPNPVKIPVMPNTQHAEHDNLQLEGLESTNWAKAKLAGTHHVAVRLNGGPANTSPTVTLGAVATSASKAFGEKEVNGGAVLSTSPPPVISSLSAYAHPRQVQPPKLRSTAGATGTSGSATGTRDECAGGVTCKNGKAQPPDACKDRPGASRCATCDAGHTLNASNTSCIACAAGRFLPPGSEECQDCAAGSVAPSTGSISCSVCAPGKHIINSSAPCVNCAVGRYTVKSRQSNCSMCGVGKFAPAARNLPSANLWALFDVDVLSLTNGDVVNAWANEEGTVERNLVLTAGKPKFVRSAKTKQAWVSFDGQSQLATTQRVSTPTGGQVTAIISCTVNMQSGWYQQVIGQGHDQFWAVRRMDKKSELTMHVRNSNTPRAGYTTSRDIIVVGRVNGKQRSIRVYDAKNGKSISSGSVSDDNVLKESQAILAMGWSERKKKDEGFIGLIRQIVIYDAHLSDEKIVGLLPYFTLDKNLGAAKTNCTPCLAGQFQGNEGAPSCTNCRAGHVAAKSGQTNCSACTRGKGPNPARTACRDCQGIQFSTCGICKDCKAPNVRLSATLCVAPNTACQPGSAPLNDSDSRGSSAGNNSCGRVERCKACPPGSVSSNGAQCVACKEGNRVANPAQVACEGCGPGTQPTTDRSRCVDCNGTNFSAFGVQCELCDRRFIINQLKSKCTACPAGKGPTKNQSACLDCAPGKYSSAGVCDLCVPGPVGQTIAAFAGSVVCRNCPAGKVAHNNATECRCAAGTYNISAMVVRCFSAEYFPRDETEIRPLDRSECQPCPPCLDCANVGQPVVQSGYRLRESSDQITVYVEHGLDSMSQITPRQFSEHHGFMCPYEPSCLSGTVNQTCLRGHTGILCQNCETGWSKTHSGSCFECEAESSGGVWVLWALAALVLLAMATVYCGLSIYLSRKHKAVEQAEQGSSAGFLFDCLDTDSSGTITREELRTGLAELGMVMSERETFKVMESVDIDGSGDIDRDEFEAWMAHLTSKSEQWMAAIRILIGYVQVLKDAPRLMKEEIQFPTTWRNLQLVSVDLSLFIPCIPVDYYSRFIANTIVSPAVLLGLVFTRWAIDNTSGQSLDSLSPGELARRNQERRTQQKSDYYLAFFLVYPTISKTFFDHFDCRTISEKLSVLSVDNSITCQDNTWVLFAIFAALGLVTVSFGIPLALLYTMRKAMNKKKEQIHNGQKKAVVAYNEFGQQFDYVVGNYRTNAWYTESLDLIKKLLLSGMIMFIHPGTVIQCVASMLISLFFLILHAFVWPYPHAGANLLKLYTEVQVFLVMCTTLIFRINNDDLSGETVHFFRVTADHQFYATVLEFMLLSTTLAVAVAVGWPTHVQRVQRAIAKTAKKSPATLEQAATSVQARDRIRAAASIVIKNQSSLRHFLARREAADMALKIQAVFEEIDLKSSPAGTITADEFIEWWTAAEPPDRFESESGTPQAVTSYSRVDRLHGILVEVCSPGDRMDRDDFEGALEILLEMDFEKVNDAATEKVHYLNTVNRKTMWTLPSAAEWLTELHNAKPPQLKLPACCMATSLRSLSPHDQQNNENEGVEANPLFGRSGAREDEWQERPSGEHGGRIYWFNARTRQTQWERPTEIDNEIETPAAVQIDGNEPQPEPEPERVERESETNPATRSPAQRPLPTLETTAHRAPRPPGGTPLAEIFQQVDTDGNGTISFEEFSAWWSERQLATTGELKQETMDEIYRVWDEYDADDNSELDLDEFEAVLEVVAESVWQRAVDPKSGRPYFYHRTTKETRWVAIDSAEQVLEFLKGQGIEIEHGFEM